MKYAMRKLTALALTLVLCMSMLPAALAAESSFTDITDPAAAQNVEVLRMMGVIDGMTETTFDPNGTLTRAQFCKMAIVMLGKADQVNIYKNYTIFPDVKGSHWAAGYVNMAVRGENRFISGFTDGTFGPDRTITYGQAITILMRLLGYTDADVGIVWPEGYINAAVEKGVTKGVSLSGSSAITRAQAAQLFVNLLNAERKGGGSFISSIGNAVSGVILLDADTRDDAGAAAILTSEGTYPLAGRSGSTALTGRKGTVLLNDAGKVVTFIPTNVGSSKDITIASAAADKLTDSAGVSYAVYSDTLTYFNNERGTYGTDRVFFRAGTQATVYTGATGKVEFIVVGAAASDEAVVVSANGSAAGFELLTDRTDYKIYKNGEIVTASALRVNDVATYASASNTIYINDSHLSVYYKNAYPNTTAPTTITVTGISQPLQVLRCAADTLSDYDLGDTMTILLTYDGRVAGAVNGRASTVGYVSGDQVQMFNGVTFDCDMPDNVESFAGQLVTVSARSRTAIALTRFSGSNVSGSLNVAARTVGNTALAGDVRVYEKVGASALTEISLADIAAETVAADKIDYAHKNSSGRIDILVLDDVTGDRYTYGRMTVEWVSGGFGEMSYRNRYATVHSGNGVTVGPLMCAAFDDGDWGGIVATASGDRAAGFVQLREIEEVPISAWRSEDLLYYENVAYMVSEDIACYNSAADVWFENLSDALAFGEEFTIYVDSNNVVRGLEVG